MLVAHGSRRQASNQEVELLVEQLRQRLSGKFERVEGAFLELAEPAVDQQLCELAAAGIEEIVILPYFLAAGKHVEHDLPELLEQTRKQYPQCQLTLLNHIGLLPGLLSLIEQVLD